MAQRLEVASAVLNSLVLIGIHLPAAHHRLAETGASTLWLLVITPVIGTAYCFSVLRTAGLVPVGIRRTVLSGAQEVWAFIGLLSIFGAWTAMTHVSPSGVGILGPTLRRDLHDGGGRCCFRARFTESCSAEMLAKLVLLDFSERSTWKSVDDHESLRCLLLGQS